MSDLDRILKLAGRVAETEAHSQAEREMKAEAVGDSAECFYDMQDEFAGGEAEGAHKVLIDELVRYLSGDQLEDFCDDFKRHHDMGMDEAAIEEDDLDENAFNQAAAAAKRAGKEEFEFNGKKYKTTMDKSTAHQLDDDVQFEAEDDEDEDHIEPFSDDDYDEFGVRKSTSFNTPPKKNESEESDEETLEEAACDCDCGESPCKECGKDHHDEAVNEAPTMDTTQMITLMRNAGLSEDKIEEKLNEWANSAPMAAEQEQTSHGEPYENFAQSVNLSLKRYLDAEAQKVSVSEHTVEDMKALYESKKSSSK